MSDSIDFEGKRPGVYVFENPELCTGEHAQNCIRFNTKDEAVEYIDEVGFENGTIEEIR